MPNWCSNSLALCHDDPAQIERAVKAFNDGKLFNEFFPCPEDLVNTMSGFYGKGTPEQEELEKKQALNTATYGFPTWYEWNIANWGTKWDVQGSADCASINNDGKLVHLSFESAWSPPTAWYERMVALGFGITAYYYEGGCGFCGKWENGSDECYNIEGDSKWVIENIPQEIDEAMSISYGMAEWEELQEDEEDPVLEDNSNETPMLTAPTNDDSVTSTN
jgi:hypothetical protein